MAPSRRPYVGTFLLLAALLGVATSRDEASPYALRDRRAEVEPNNDSTQATPIVLGDSATGTIASGSDVDWFAIPLTDGTWVDFRVVGSNAGIGDVDDYGPFVYLHSWYPLGFIQPGSRMVARIGESGRFFAAINPPLSGVAPAEPDYVVSFGTAPAEWVYEAEPNDDGDSALPVSPGDTIAGVFDFAGDQDFYALDLQAGDGVHTSVARQVHASGRVFVSPRFTLIDPDGVVLADRFAAFDIVIRAQKPGRHHLVMSNYHDEGSSWHGYLLVLTGLAGDDATAEVEQNDTPGEATPIDVGRTAYGIIGTPGDVDYYAIDLAEGAWVEFALGDLSFGRLAGAAALLQDDATTVVASISNNSPPYRPRQVFEILATGRYYIRVQDVNGAGGSTHAYGVGVRTWTAAEKVALERESADVNLIQLGDTLAVGIINPAGDVDRFRVEVPAGHVVELDGPGPPQFPEIPGFRSQTTCTGAPPNAHACDVVVSYYYPGPMPGATPHLMYTIAVRYPSVVASGDAAAHLLGTQTLTPADLALLDALGNGDGEFDVGDLRALLVWTGEIHLPDGASTP